MKPAIGTLRVSDDLASLSRAGANYLCKTAQDASGRILVALSGGNTPKPMYQLLAQDPVRSQLPWDRVHWILGDERFVPPSDPDSNFGMARDAFLSQVPVPAENVHPVPTKGVTLEEAAEQYEAMLMSLYGSKTLRIDPPLLNINFLGLGPDGHTASLLPGQPVLQETKRWVAPVPHGRPQPRVSLTYPALDSSRVVAFLVAGEEKREILDKIWSGDTSVPAGRIRPVGEVIWFVDKAAAGRWA